MITRDNALKIFKKYGYNSKSVHPYLYVCDKVIGINYSYIDDVFGIVERIATFKEENEMDLFLKKFQWYKLNGRVNNVHIELSNYEISNPHVMYIRNNHVMTDAEMFDIESFDKREAKNKKLSHTKRVIEEVQELMDYYYLKKEEFTKFINNHLNKKNELGRYYSELQLLINDYNGKKFDVEYKNKNITYEIKSDMEDKVNINLAKARSSKIKEEDAYKLLNDVWLLNKSLELNNNYLDALQHDDDLDEEMRLVITKIDYMKELLKKKCCFFKKVNLIKALNNIDSTSTYKSIYDTNFIDKFTLFVNDKYEAINKVNEFKLCEYLNDFVGNNEFDIARNIKKCSDELNDLSKENNMNFESIKEDLTKQFNNNLNEDEKNALILFTSIYHDLFEMIMQIQDYQSASISHIISLLNITDGFVEVYDRNYNLIRELLELDANKKIKNTVFKTIDFSNKNKFIESIRNNINLISNINDKIKFKYNFKLYFDTNNFNNLNNDKFIFTSNNINNFMNYKTNNRIIIANIKSEINVLFAPLYLKLPITNAYNQEIELIDEVNPQVILDCKDIIINEDNGVIILSKFKGNIINREDYSYVNNFTINYKFNINKVMIEKRNNNE